jgi:serine phosphatase RsbU (regulator of sigma subunit)
VFRTDRQSVSQVGLDLPFNAYTTRLMEGDVVYLFTDGLADQFGGPNGRKFGHKALRDLFASVGHLSMNEQRRAVVQAMDAWRGDLEQVVDMCLMAVRINALDRMVLSAG